MTGSSVRLSVMSTESGNKQVLQDFAIWGCEPVKCYKFRFYETDPVIREIPVVTKDPFHISL